MEDLRIILLCSFKEANLDPTVITRTKYASEICGYISAKLERQRRKRSCLEPQEQDGSDEDDGEPFQLGESDESDSDSVEYLGSPREEDLGIGGRRDWYGNAEEEGAEAESERESCWRQPTEEARYNLDLKKSFLPLQLFLRRRLTKLQLPQSQATSFLACCMISGLSMEKMRKLFEDISASPTFYPGKFTSTIHDRMIRFKSQFPKKIDLELLVNMTEAFFETAADSKQELFSGKDHDLSNKNLLCQTSDEALRRESYSELETFYKDVLENCFDETPEKAIEAAEACVDAWRISGISCRDLETISAAAVVNKECLGQFVSRAKRMLEAMSCFLSPSVNASMLIAVTLMYAKAKRALKDHCCSLANRKVEGGDLGTLKKPVVAHILEEGKPGESDELKIEAQFDKIAASIGRVFDVESLVSVLEKQIILGSSGIPDSVKKAAFKLALASHFRLLAEGKPALLILEEIIVFSEKMSEARKNLAAGEKADDTKEKEDEEDIDMEDGEVLTDDEDPEKEANNEKVKKKENRLAFEVDSTGDPSTTVEVRRKILYKFEQIVPIFYFFFSRFQSKVDSSTFLKNIYDRGLRYELGDSHLVIGNHRFAKDAMSNFLQSSENGDQVQYYPMMSVLVFVDHLKEPHNSYLKLAESSHPDLVTVDRKDRIPLKLFFEESEFCFSFEFFVLLNLFHGIFYPPNVSLPKNVYSLAFIFSSSLQTNLPLPTRTP